MATDWSDKAKATFNKLWAERPRPTYDEIARVINTECKTSLTRSAVSGRVKRLGLGEGHKPPPTRSGPRKPRPMQSRQNGHDGALAKRMAKAMHAPPPKLMKLPDTPKDEDFKPVLVTFKQLQPHHCRWPIGDGDALRYCGCPVLMDRGMYCAYHLKAKRQ